MNIPIDKNLEPRPIKRFKELYLYCDENNAHAFFERLNKFLANESQSGRWARDTVSMARLEDSVCFKKGLFSGILLCDDQGQPFASVTLTYDEDKSRIWLCNIVPCQTNEFSYDEYNGILDRFLGEVVEKNKQNLECKTVSGMFTGADVMSSDTWKLLLSFSYEANRSALHPLDVKAWHRFVISAFREDSKLDATTLGRILCEELGWSERESSRLAIRYEDEMGLLEEYDHG